MSAWDNPSEMLARAETAQAQGDRDLAYQMYARASELSPQDAHAWQGRAATATSADEALISYAYASSLDPQDQSLAQKLDNALAERVMSATREDVPLLNAVGQEMAEVGLKERAHILFVRAAELDPTSTDALVWAAGTTTDSQEQQDYLNRALAINPSDERARAALRTLQPTPAPTVIYAPPELPISNAPSTQVAQSTANLQPSTFNLSTSTPADEVAKLMVELELAATDDEREQLYDRILALEPDNLQIREARTMLRVRRLRDSARQTTNESAPTRRRRTESTSVTPDVQRLRTLLFILLALVLILAIAGVILIALQ